MRISALFALALTLAAAPALARTPCGGSFASFVADLKQEAQARGHDRATVERFFASVRQDADVLRADRAQGFFQNRLPSSPAA